MEESEPIRTGRRFRISRLLVIHTLCCADGIMLGVLLIVIRRHWAECVNFYMEIMRCASIIVHAAG